MPPDPRTSVTGLKKVYVEGRTDGLFLTLAFEQHYENNSADPLEILYSFPIPCQAIVLGMEAAMLGKPMEVAYRERADAEDIYEAGQEKRQFAAMVQRLSAGLCSVSLGTLRPGGNAMLRLRIGMFVDVTSGRGRIVVPTVVNYPDGTGAVLPFAGQTSRDVMAEYPLTLTLVLTDHAASALVSSPTHALSKKVRGEQATVTLSERATLDRDVIVILDNLPQTDAVQCADSHGAFGVTAFTPAPVGTPKSLDLDVLIDAAGPLRSIGGELPNVLNALASLLDDKDYIAVTRFGHSVSPLLKKSDGVMARVALADFPGIATDLGDVFTGQSLPPLELRENADILLITDGSTRAA